MDAAAGLFSAQLAAQGQKPDLPATRNAAEARAVAEEFEGFVIATFAESMFAGVKTDGPFGGGHGEKVFRSLLIQEYGKEMSKAGGIGLADQVTREMLKMQEVQQ